MDINNVQNGRENTYYLCPACGHRDAVAHSRLPDGSKLCTCLTCETNFTVATDMLQQEEDHAESKQ